MQNSKFLALSLMLVTATSAIGQSSPINLVCHKMSGQVIDVANIKIPPVCNDDQICGVSEDQVSVITRSSYILERLTLSRYSGVMSLDQCYSGSEGSIQDAAKKCGTTEKYFHVGQWKCGRVTERKF